MAAEWKQEGKYVDLPDARKGEVVVRFPPEASGYLHIGHAKAALLNQYYQETFEGKLIFRFDDTNPEKENVHYEDVIRQDLAMLRVKPDISSYTSDHFEVMLKHCERMIQQGKAYVDDTPAEQMKTERESRTESRRRGASIEDNLTLWREMLAGSVKGKECCVRAKIDMSSNNGCMRDPTIYRCKAELHPRTGDKYKVYPTYDFACPIVDSLEGVTHALRTTEYTDRDPQFNWFCEALGIRRPSIWSYARLNMKHTLMSKRKLTWLVDERLVDGWDDARMPTVRGVLRRGMTVDGLKQFIIAQGSSRSVVFMDWDKIWSFNRKIIDPIAVRYSGVELRDATVVTLDGGGSPPTELEVNCHPKNPSLGMRKIKLPTNHLLVDQLDAQLLKVNDIVTFINWGNLLITNVSRNAATGLVTNVTARLNLENKDFKKTMKITWLPDCGLHNTRATCIYYEHLIKKPEIGKDEDFKQFVSRDTKREVEMFVDTDLLSRIKRGDVIQLQRKGFFIVDSESDKPLRLISIPDGSTDLNIFPKSVQEWKKSLRAEYEKAAATPAMSAPPPPSSAIVPSTGVDQLSAQIQKTGDTIRDLKAKKSAKAELDPHIAQLLSLKAEYKKVAGKDWQPGAPGQAVPPPKPATPAGDQGGGGGDLSTRIAGQGDKIRDLKSKKVPKTELEPEIAKLLSLKAEYKSQTGSDWQPNAAPGPGPKQPVNNPPPATNGSSSSSSSSSSDPAASLSARIQDQGDKIRKLKNDKVAKSVLDPEIAVLLKLKTEYKELAGKDWTPTAAGGPSSAAGSSAARAAKPAKPAATPSQPKTTKEKPAAKPAISKPTPQAGPSTSAVGDKKQTRLGMETKKCENFPEWYTEVITKAEMIEYYDVSGCYVLRPWSFAIWEAITAFFDQRIKESGVRNCYFPMFVSRAALEREASHIADFAPEVAWVTKSGGSDLAEPIAIRPTSETVMYPSYARWVQSHRDLPIRLNQWCNVVRWEFKSPTPFLRTREFLWQEGHSAFATQPEATDEVMEILEYYAAVYEQLLAIPVIRGRKTEKEKFAGGDFTTTVEGYIPANGRGIQGATSHHLGQNFSKMFDITFEDPSKPGEKIYAYQNSWGISTRTIGVLIMVHGDDKGLVLPPEVACIQVVIVPCGITADTTPEAEEKLLSACRALGSLLKVSGKVRVHTDLDRNRSPGWKFNNWELKGVPLRIELGPRDLQKRTFVAVRRDTGAKMESMDLDHAVVNVTSLLDEIQKSMYARAKREMDTHLAVTDSWDEFQTKLDRKFLIMAPYCGAIECEDAIKRDSAREDVIDSQGSGGGPLMGAKSLCIPFDQPRPLPVGVKCIHPACKAPPKNYTLFGRSY